MNALTEWLLVASLMVPQVQQDGGTLSIEGTAAADDLFIETVATGDVVITDNDTGDSEEFFDVTRIIIHGRRGNDILTLGELDLDGGRLSVYGDDGHDQLLFGGNVFAAVRAFGGGGHDLVDFGSAGLEIDGNVLIEAGAGADDVSAGDTHFLGFLAIDTDAGSDVVEYDLVEVEGYFHLQLGAGHDEAFGSGCLFHWRVHIEGEAGDDWVHHDADTAGNVYETNLQVQMGAGRDLYEEIDGTVDGNFNANGGPGRDSIDVSGTVFNGTRKIRSF